MKENRGPWYLLTALVLGLVGGLIYSLVINPTKWSNTSPYALNPEAKDQYRVLIALAFEADSDLERARARLLLLQYPNYASLTEEQRKTGIEQGIHELTLQGQRALVENHPQAEVYAIGRLALALNQGFVPPTPPPPPTLTAPVSTGASATPAVSPSTATPVVIAWTKTPTLTPASATETPGPGTPSAIPPTPTATRTPPPTITPTPTQGAPFALQSRDLLCDQNPPSPQIRVEILDAAGQPVAGVELIVSWTGGEDHFFTGLKPEIGLGYADFDMASGLAYSLRLTDGGQPITNLTAERCTDGSWGVWQLIFAQP